MIQAVTKKRTTRTGRAIGRKPGEVVTLHINDPGKFLSRMLEVLKKHYGKKKIPAAEIYSGVVKDGLLAAFEKVAHETEEIALENMEQKKLF